MNVEFFLKRLENLKSERSTWESHWQELADFMRPNHNNILSSYTPGQKKNQHLYDNTAMHSAELLAGSLQGTLVNPNSIWFEFTTGDGELDKVDDVRAWLQDSASRVHRVLNNTNFQPSTHSFFMDLVVFGTSSMSVEEDEENIVRFAPKAIQENYIAENSQKMVNEIYRCFKWDAKKIMEEWDKESLPPEIIHAFEKEPSRKFEVVHAIAPKNLLEKVGMKTDIAQAFVSIYILKDLKHVLEKKGFNEFPYLVARWEQGSDEIYGRSPGMTALPEAKVLNKIVEQMLMAAEKMIDPPLQLPDDGFIMPIITSPGSLNFYRAGSNDRIEPVFNNQRLDIGIEIMREHQEKIKKAFRVDMFVLRDGPQKTATEVIQLTEEQSRFLAPFLGRQQHEFLRPLIERVFKIMSRRNQFKEPPEELDGIRLDVRYSSLIARSHRIDEGNNIMRTLQMSEAFMNMSPDSVDNFDSDKAIRKIAEIFNTPQEIFRSVDDIEALREARAQAQEAMLEQQEQQAQANVAQKVAPLAQVVGNSGRQN